MFQYYKQSRHFVFSAFIAFVFVLLCQNTAFARASSNGDLPTKANLQAQLNSLNKQKDLSAQNKLMQQNLTNTLATLNKINRIKKKTVQLRQKVAKAPKKMRQATAALTALSNVNNNKETRKILSTLSLRQLKTRVAQALNNLQNAQNNLASYNSQLVSLQTQPKRVQNAMYNASQQLQQIRSHLNKTNVGKTALRPSQKVLMQAQQALLNAKINQQRKSLKKNTVLQNTLQKQRNYVTANSAHLKHQLQLLQKAVNSKRLTLTKKTAQKAVSPNKAARIQANPLIKQKLKINQQLSQRLITATKNGNQLMQQNIKVKNWLKRALQSKRNIKKQIAVLKGSLLLSRILYQQQQTLPSANKLKNITNRIANLRLKQFKVNQQRNALFQSNAFVNKLKEGHTNKVNSKVHNALLQVVNMRRKLLNQLNKQLGNQLIMAINLQINQQQLISVSKNLKSILTQQIFWVNSNRPIN